MPQAFRGEHYRMYKQTLLFLMIHAIDTLYPALPIEVHQSVAHATYCRIVDPLFRTEEVLSNIEAHMQHLIDSDMPLSVLTVPPEEAYQIYMQNGETDKAESLACCARTSFQFFDTGYKKHALYAKVYPTAGCVREFKLTMFQDGFMLRYPNEAAGNTIPKLTASRKILQTLVDYRRWHSVLDLSDVFDLNAAIREGKAKEIVNISESLHEKMISDLADTITADRKLRVVLISGPSSSGKTSFANRLRIHLRVNGINPVVLSMDDYYRGRTQAPLDENGNYDYECPEALDYELFNNHLEQIIRGETVNTPLFDFNSGNRMTATKPVSLGANQILIVEGIHALNEIFSSKVVEENKFKIYCTPLTVMSFDTYNPLSPTDLRLLRRTIRDTKFRKSPAENTLSMWKSVRRGEKKHIFPFEHTADHIFNSSLSYEFCVIKEQAEKELKTIPESSPHYETAKQLLEFLSYFCPIPEDLVPPTSILREFIGGSTVV